MNSNKSSNDQTAENMQKCSKCKVSRHIDNFIGKKNNPVKICLKCRERDEIQKQRPDIIEKRKEYCKKAKNYQKYRERKREENEEEFLKHNAEIAKKWRERNKEHLKEWGTQNFVKRFGGIKQQAQEKCIQWKEDLTDEICYKMMTSKCHYCGFYSDKTLNGIDRMNSAGYYEKSNTVSCCKKCNFIKGSLDPITFIQRCQHISYRFNGFGILRPEIWSNSNSSSYRDYILRSTKKEYEFNLTIEEFDTLKTYNCYYCGKEPSEEHHNGIDRFDNNIGYNLENCVSCCRECNQMKITMSFDDFIDTCKRVSQYTLENTIEIPDIPICKNRIMRREKHHIEKEKIIITKQQPPKEKPAPPVIEPYIPKIRVYSKGTNIPEGCSIKAEDIPNYCYYVPPKDTRGDGFCCGRLHPKQKQNNKNDWLTTRSVKVSTEEKYKMLMDYINSSDV